MIGKLAVPSGRFARGTVLLARHFLYKAEIAHTKSPKRRILA